MAEARVGAAAGLLLVLFTFQLLLLLNHGEGAAAQRVYNTGAQPVQGKLNVHLVAHTHDDLGWLQTPDEYYVGPDPTRSTSLEVPAVQFIIRTIVQELQDDPNRKFSYVEMGFFVRWWREQSPAKQAAVKQLMATGQLEFVNGGWCMHDEAATHYLDMIDQTTLGHRYLTSYFGYVPRNGWQIDPFGHSAVQAYLLGAEAGFDGVFVARIDYQDRQLRKATKTLEMIWRGSETLGASAQIFMGVFPSHYAPPSTFEFEVYSDAYVPVQDDVYLEGYNIDQRVDDLVEAAEQQANVTQTNHIMWTMGDDFTYQTAGGWYSPMDKLIHYANLDGRVNVLYSTPSIYLASKHAANESWPLKTGDFFPYADGPQSYWTGYFTSRPALKGYVRTLSAYLQAARQLEFFFGRQTTGVNFTTDSLEEAMATAQHHDGVSGTSKQVVADDYALKLYIGAEESKQVVNRALKSLLGTLDGNFTVEQCGLLNVTYCPISESVNPLRNGSFVDTVIVVAYNSLGWPRTEYISIPVSTENVSVADWELNVITSQTMPISNVTRTVRDFYVEANLGVQVADGPLFHLVFQASVPPLGYTSFYITPQSPGVPTAVSSIIDPPQADPAVVQIGNGILNLNFSSKTGLLVNLSTNKTGSAFDVSQRNLWYESFNGSTQSSGAYIFLPANSTPRPVGDPNDVQVANLTVVSGPVVQEVRQVFSPWVSQVTRLYKDQPHVEIEFTIGPIPIDDGLGKEVITRISTGIESNKVFYTDSNGRDFLKRVRDYRDSWNLTVVQPISGNYYPINLGVYITDNETDFSVLVDRAVGGSSIVDGQVEIMLHRRLLADDGRGVGEALNETVCVKGKSCEGLTIQGRYLFAAQPSEDAAEWRRTQGQAMVSPLLMAFTRPSDDANMFEFSAIQPGLPSNVALLTLQELESGSVLVRLAHLYQANEHPVLSNPATVDLQSLFYESKIVTATEMSITANQLRSEITPLQWMVEGENPGGPPRGGPLVFNSTQVELGPMEIRTFLVWLHST